MSLLGTILASQLPRITPKWNDNSLQISEDVLDCIKDSIGTIFNEE